MAIKQLGPTPATPLETATKGYVDTTIDALPSGLSVVSTDAVSVTVTDDTSVGVGTSDLRGEATSSLYPALPFTTKAIRTYNDSTTPTLRLIALGSSVGQGPDGTLDAVNSVSARLFLGLQPILNRTGSVILTHTNASVSGTTITSGQQTDYAAAKTAAGGSPILVPLIYGMNDGMPAQYHQGQTLPGVYNNGKTLIQAIQGDGADAIIYTTPHPHSTRTPWGITGDAQYPVAGTPVPAATSGASIVTVTSRSGVDVPASYRHLRVNQALRQLGADTGVPVIDVESYWFDAVAEFGEDALFDTGQYNHPNLFAFQATYFAATEHFLNSYNATTYAAPAPAPREVFVRKPQHTTRTSTTTLTADPDLGAPAAAFDVVIQEYRVHYTTPTAADLRLGVVVPTGATGRFTVSGPAATATGTTSDAVFRSSSISSGNYIEVGGNNADGVAFVTATVEMGSTAGRIELVWCQDSSNAGNTMVYANSTLRSTTIA